MAGGPSPLAIQARTVAGLTRSSSATSWTVRNIESACPAPSPSVGAEPLVAACTAGHPLLRWLCSTVMVTTSFAPQALLVPVTPKADEEALGTHPEADFSELARSRLPRER